MKEDEFRGTVLVPLFQKMGFKDVFEYHGGPLEQGKDIVMWEEGRLGQRVNYAVVVKARKITGKAGGTGGVGEVTTQVRQALGSPFKDSITGSDEEVHQCFVVCPKINKEALNALKGSLEEHQRKATTFLHGDKLWEKIEEHLPEKTVMQKLEEVQEVLAPHRITALVGERIGFALEGREDGGDQPPTEISTRLEFPDSAEGREAEERLRKAISTGASATVEGAFVKEILMPEEMRKLASIIGFDDSTVSTIKMESNVAKLPPMPLRLEVWKDENLTGVYDYLELRVTQNGQDEITLTNDHHPAALKIRMVLKSCNQEAKQNYTVEIQGSNAYEVLRALRFHNALAAGGTLKILHWETGIPIGGQKIIPGESGLKSISPFWMEILEKLNSIQQKIRVPIEMPGRNLTKEESQEILEIAAILREGRLELQPKDWTIGIEKRRVKEFFDNMPPGKPQPLCMEDDHVQCEILGVRIDMGKRVVRCAQAYISKAEAKRVHERVKHLKETESVTIKMKPFDKCPLVAEYPKWLAGPEQTMDPKGNEKKDAE